MKLVRYLKRCVTLQAADGLADFGDTKRWMPVDVAVEQIVAGTRGDLPMSSRLQAIAQQLQPGEVLQYGWPTVVVVDRKGVTRLAPLLVTELERAGEDSFVATEDPALNVSVLGDQCFAPEDVEALAFAFESTAEGERPDMLAAVLDAAANALGSGRHDMNPQALSTHLAPEPGLYNVAVVVRAENSAITRGLLQELEELETRTDWQHTAAAGLISTDLRHHHPAGQHEILASSLPLSDTQERALAATRSGRLTVVTGPPGTGKSQFVVAAATNAWLSGESTLLASTNNAAVDVAVARARQLHPGLLIRTGNQMQRVELPSRVSMVLADASQAPPSPTEVAGTRAELSVAYRERAQYFELLAEISKLECGLVDVTVRENDLRSKLWGSGATPPADHTEILAAAAGASRAWLLRGRKKRRVVRRFGVAKEATFEQLAQWAELATRLDASSLALQGLRGRAGDVSVRVAEVDDRWQEASTRAAQAAIRTTLGAHRAAVSGLGAIRQGGRSVASAMPAALKGALGWACTALSVKPNFPLQPGLLDQVIIDEAAQCTLAEALPLAYRAKRLVVVGDPNQLTPIVRIDHRTLNDVARSSGFDPDAIRQAGIDYGTGSAFLAFAYVVGQGDLWLLDEHYRCHPLIARWFNEAFYGGLLTVLTSIEGMTIGHRGLQWVDVSGTAERGPTGSSMNREEAEAVVGQVGQLLDSGRSIGVVTPFAAQANMIREMAKRRFGAEALSAVDFAAATAHRFQGGERDVVVFSSVVAPGIAPRSARWVEDQRNLINVAASRAREHLIVFGHPTAALEFNLPTLGSLRSVAIEGLEPAAASWKVHSESERRLLDALHDAGAAPLVKPVEEGFELDFVLIRGGKRLNIEVDGGQHLDERGRQRRQDVARDAVLSAVGWKVIRFPAWRCLKEPDAVAREAMDVLAAL